MTFKLGIVVGLVHLQPSHALRVISPFEWGWSAVIVLNLHASERRDQGFLGLTCELSIVSERQTRAIVGRLRHLETSKLRKRTPVLYAAAVPILPEA